jgi:hypothetical protein
LIGDNAFEAFVAEWKLKTPFQSESLKSNAIVVQVAFRDVPPSSSSRVAVALSRQTSDY